jgi:hypothetical protein
MLLGVTAFIWIVIKLPQEWWIHVAQLDTTDVIKEVIFGVSVDTSWLDAIAARPWVVVVVAVVLAALAVGTWWLFANVLPPADRPVTLDADAEEARPVRPTRMMAVREQLATNLWDRQLLEKVVLVSLVSIIFAQMLGVAAGPLAVVAGLSLVIVVNAAVSDWMVRRGRRWVTPLGQFGTMLLLNLAIYVLFVVAGRLAGIELALDRAAFFLLLMSLLVTLYDRYRPEYLARFAPDADLP